MLGAIGFAQSKGAQGNVSGEQKGTQPTTNGLYNINGSYPSPDSVVKVTNTNTGFGISSVSNGGTGLYAQSNAATGYAVRAKNNAGGTAIFAEGKADIQGDLNVTGNAVIPNLTIPANSVGSGQILDGAIVDVDISRTANITASKINRSGLDADLLDGLNSTAFLRNTADIQTSGNLKIDGMGDSYILGKLGIGTTSPSQKLEVTGTIRTDDLITKGPWVDVRAYGAKGDGQTDDTAAIQAAIDDAGPGATILVPPGVYLIDPIQQGNLGAIRPLDGDHLILYGATLQSTSADGKMINVGEWEPRANVRISGGTLAGIKTFAPSGIGIQVSNATNVILEDMIIQDFWAEGIGLGGDPGAGATGIRILRCKVVNSGNNGVVIAQGSDILIQDCEVTQTGGIGISGQIGLNVEVPHAGDVVSDVRVVGGRYSQNKGHGIYFHPASGAAIREVRIEGVTIESNGIGNPEQRNSGLVIDGAEGVYISGVRVIGHSEHGAAGISVSHSSRVFVGHNRVEDTWRSMVFTGTSHMTVIGNEVVGRYPDNADLNGDDQDGIVVQSDTIITPTDPPVVTYWPAESVTVTANRVRQVNGMGIKCADVTRLQVIGNDVAQSGQHGMYIWQSTEAMVAQNRVTASSLETSQLFDDISVDHGSDRATVTGNVCRNDPALATVARAGIRLTSSDDDVLITGNDLRGSSDLSACGTTAILNLDGSGNNWNLRPPLPYCQ